MDYYQVGQVTRCTSTDSTNRRLQEGWTLIAVFATQYGSGVVYILGKGY